MTNTRKYIVVSCDVSGPNKGKKTPLSRVAEPMTHDEACTFKSKCTPRPWSEIYLEEVR